MAAFVPWGSDVEDITNTSLEGVRMDADLSASKTQCGTEVIDGLRREATSPKG